MPVYLLTREDLPGRTRLELGWGLFGNLMKAVAYLTIKYTLCCLKSQFQVPNDSLPQSSHKLCKGSRIPG